METDLAVLAQRVSQLERVMGTPADPTDDEGDNASGSPQTQSISALAELRAAERRLSAIVPTELETAVRTMRMCRTAVSALESDTMLRRARAALASSVVDDAVAGLREMQILQQSIDGAHYNLDEVVAAAPQLETVSEDGRALHRFVAADTAQVDVLLERYNRAVAAANAAVLRVAAAVRQLESVDTTAGEEGGVEA